MKITFPHRDEALTKRQKWMRHIRLIAEDVVAEPIATVACQMEIPFEY